MVTEPQSMEDLVYFTNRKIENGNIKAWVYRKECPKCHKAKMSKPVEKGKVKTRASEYVCPKCGYKEERKEHEDTLTVEIKYTCPYCSNTGEATAPYQRKKFEGVDAYVFTCRKCGKKIGITKKLKKPKKK